MTAPRTATRAGRRLLRTAGQLVGVLDVPYTGIRRHTILDPLNADGMITVRGRPRYPSRGSLYGTAFYGELSVNVWQAGYFLAHPHGRLLPHRVTLGGRTAADLEREGHEASRLAVLAATAAAGRVLGVPPTLTGGGARVLAVVDGSPAAAAFAAGDVLTAVAGKPVHTTQEALAAVVAALREGGPVPVTVLREQSVGGDGQPVPVLLDPPTGPDGSRPLGVRLVTHRPALTSPLDVEVHLPADNLGPSLGLMLTLAIIDVCSPGELTGGRSVAGTGTIDLHGAVGEVGGVDYKASSAQRAGMSLMFVPEGAGAEARGAAPRLDVVEVGHVDEALDVLAHL